MEGDSEEKKKRGEEGILILRTLPTGGGEGKKISFPQTQIEGKKNGKEKRKKKKGGEQHFYEEGKESGFCPCLCPGSNAGKRTPKKKGKRPVD